MQTPDLQHHEPIIRSTIGALTDLMAEDQREAAQEFMLKLLHEDPHYFRMGEGSTKSRLAYAVSRIFVTRIRGSMG